MRVSKEHWIRQLLILSLSLNLALLALVAYFSFFDSRLTLACKPKVEEEVSLFQKLKEGGSHQEHHAFFTTDSFTLIHTLLSRSSKSVPRETVLSLLLEGGEELFLRKVKEQQERSSLSSASRQRFLCDYISMGSKTAAELLISLDLDFALLLPNDELAHLLSLLDEPSPEVIDLLQGIVEEKRSPWLHRQAQERLALITGEAIHPEPKQEIADLYAVQPGDSLWLIAHRLQISMKKIREVNQLSSDTLRPGQKLKIPR